MHSISAERGKAIRKIIATHNVFLINQQEHADDIRRTKEASEEFWLKIAFVLQGDIREVAHKLVTISSEEIVHRFSQFLNDEMDTGEYSTVPGNEGNIEAASTGGGDTGCETSVNEQQFLKTLVLIWSNGINLYWSFVRKLEEFLSKELDHFQCG